MDLKDFQHVQDDEGVDNNAVSASDTAKDIMDKAKDTSKKNGKNGNGKKVAPLVDSEFHDESTKIIKDLEARIAALNSEGEKSEKHAEVKTDTHEAENGDIYEGGNPDEVTSADDDTETVIVQEGEGESFLDKIKPFILPIFLTIFALLFAIIFMYFFSKGKVERSAQAIVNNQAQPEVIIIKEEKPKVEVVVEPEVVVPECDEVTQILNEETNECEDLPEPEQEPEVVGFENGTTTTFRVRFSYDKFNYDNYPRGIYLLGEQIFGEENQYEDFKLLPTSRPDANDMFFGIDRYMVSLLGACQYVVDDATILVSKAQDSEGGPVYSAIKDKYFRGKVEKIVESSKPHIVCGK